MDQCSRPSGRARHPISGQSSPTAGRGTVLTKDSTTSRALECSPTGDYQTPSLPQSRPECAPIRALGVPAGPPAAALDPGPGGAGRRPRRPWGGRSQAGRPRPPTPGDSAGIGLGCSVQRQVGAVEDPHGPSLGWPAGLCRMGQQAGRGRRNRWDIARADRTTLGWCTCGTPTTCRGLASRQSPGLPGSDWDTYLRRHCTAITGWLGRDERQSQMPSGPALCIRSPKPG
jgi:hypothetical protein